MSKQLLCTCITLFSTFLWLPLHDYDVKPPNATFYGGRGHTRTNFPFAIWTWIKPLRIQLKDKSPTFDEFGGSKLMQWSLKRPKFIFLVMFSLPSSSSSSLVFSPLQYLNAGTGYASAAYEYWNVCDVHITLRLLHGCSCVCNTNNLPVASYM